jgi:uncharacterized protein (DUF305 family)
MKYILFLVCSIFLIEDCFAQQMSMDPVIHQKDKNIFLKMMDTMMMMMNKIPDSTSIESYFIRQMIPHHKGAVDMADYEIKFGKNFEMIQLAKSIKEEQENEIQLMKIWLDRSDEKKCVLPAGYRISMSQSMTRMMDEMPKDTRLGDVDRAFSLVMIPHHQAAIDMAKSAINYCGDQQTNFFAQHIISSQEVEIGQMIASIKQ